MLFIEQFVISKNLIRIQSFDENKKIGKKESNPKKKVKKERSSGEANAAASKKGHSQGKDDISQVDKKKSKSWKGKQEKKRDVINQEGTKTEKQYSDVDSQVQRSEKRDKRSKRSVKSEEINNHDEISESRAGELKAKEKPEPEDADGEKKSLLPEDDSTKSEKSSRKGKSTKKVSSQKNSKDSIDDESIDKDVVASLPQKNRKDNKSGKKSKKNKKNGHARLEDEHGSETCEKNSCAELKSAAAVLKNEVNDIENEREKIAREPEKLEEENDNV